MTLPPARLWQQAEGALVLAAALALYLAPAWSSALSPDLGIAPGTPLATVTDGQAFAWWQAILLFFAPDLSFAAYLAGPRRGAIAYNAVHLYGFGACVLAIGLLSGTHWLGALGLLWLGHAGLDRMLGYGLKLPGGFQQTHLGRIGRQP